MPKKRKGQRADGLIKASAERPERTVQRKVWRADVTAHQFRHFFATTLYYVGVPELATQRFMGHADITTTKRIYQHIRDSEQNRYTALIDDYLDKKS